MSIHSLLEAENVTKPCMEAAVVFWKQSEVVLHYNVDTDTGSNSDTHY